MSSEVVLGIDTSNYTTSVAVVGTDGELICNIKHLLKVKEGERGLRQSDAVFAHVKNLPLVMKEAEPYLCNKRLVAVGASERPRNKEGSYMPCFLVGSGVRDSISAVSNIKKYGFSHQCGHIMAALFSAQRMDLIGKNFVAFHVSGGTTEMLSVKPGGSFFEAELIGGSSDLNAGQIIDRIGVRLGLTFPCGAQMEALALRNTTKIPRKKPSVKGLGFSLSGLENLAANLFEQTRDKELTSAFIFNYISDALTEVCCSYEREYGRSEFVFAGGVMSNSIIKSNISDRFNAYFAAPACSSDNAVGIALLTAHSYNSEK